MAYGPIERLNLSPRLQVYDAMAEEVECLFPYVFGIVPVLQEGALGQLVPYFRQVMHQLVVFCSGLEILWHLRCAHALEHVEDEYAVVGSERAPALGDDARVRDAVFVRRFSQCIDAVVDILLYAVVHTALAVTASRTVVIDTESASAIYKFDVEAHCAQLYIILCYLAQGGADASDLVYLRAYMEVDELEAVA